MQAGPVTLRRVAGRTQTGAKARGCFPHGWRVWRASRVPEAPRVRLPTLAIDELGRLRTELEHERDERLDCSEKPGTDFVDIGRNGAFGYGRPSLDIEHRDGFAERATKDDRDRQESRVCIEDESQAAPAVGRVDVE